ncbi:MAG: hypothetical protein K2J08_09795 [Ruminococcus sp.]|nr:hypothetical protein [Ruminococcus sp.]
MDWAIVACFPILAAFAAMIIIAKGLSKNLFKCKHCLKEFNTDWTKLVFVMHSDNEYSIKCPYCNKKDCMIQKN